MAAHLFKLKIKDGLYQIPLPGTKAFVFDAGDGGAVLVDTGTPGAADKIFGVIGSYRMDVTSIRHILVTHLHADHTGSLAELKRRTGARVYMHKADAALVAVGRAKRRLVPAPGLVNRFLATTAFARVPDTVEAADTDVHVNDRDVLPIAGGIEVLHTPGHTEGHVAYLVPELDTLFAGDVAATLLGLRPMAVNEHNGQALMSLRRLSALDFDTACFAHGEPIQRRASTAFKKKWLRGR